ncbi:MAG: hypothetical protein ACE5D8_06790, partial [Fidelibacterota bacterium]
FRERLTLSEISDYRKKITNDGETLHGLKPTEIDYPFQFVTFKTLHIPMVLHDYVNQIQITAIFKTIHLEYLQDKTIQTIEDIQDLVKLM